MTLMLSDMPLYTDQAVVILIILLLEFLMNLDVQKGPCFCLINNIIVYLTHEYQFQ